MTSVPSRPHRPEDALPAPDPEWLKNAKPVPYRMFADEACTVEILPDANGDYWAPDGEAFVQVDR
jgi:hypothetical protein